MLLNEGQMFCKALQAIDAILRAACRPVKNQAQCDLRMCDGEREDRGTSHAATHQMRALDLEVLEIKRAHLVGGCMGCSPVLTFRSEEHTSELQSLTNIVCRL